MRVRLNWGAGIAIVYAVFVAATFAFVVFASSQKIDLVSPDYYQRALDQDRRTAAVANAAMLGDRVGVDASRDGSTLTVRWPADQRVSAGTITLYRPSNSAADRVIAAAPDPFGRQVIDAASAAAGLWRAQMQWRSGERDYYLERAVELR